MFSITGNHDGINSFIGRLSFWGPFFSDLEGKPMKIKEFYDQQHWFTVIVIHCYDVHRIFLKNRLEEKGAY